VVAASAISLPSLIVAVTLRLLLLIARTGPKSHDPLWIRERLKFPTMDHTSTIIPVDHAWMSKYHEAVSAISGANDMVLLVMRDTMSTAFSMRSGTLKVWTLDVCLVVAERTTAMIPEDMVLVLVASVIGLLSSQAPVRLTWQWALNM